MSEVIAYKLAILERMIKELYLAIRHASFYPPEHPIRMAAAREIHDLLQELLSHQKSHSITAIEDQLYIDQHVRDVDDPIRIPPDEMSIDIARRFRQHAIRSVFFYQGIEQWELERLLNLLAMKPKDRNVQLSASKSLNASKDITYVRIVDVDYENIQFTSGDRKEGFMTPEEKLTLYLRSASRMITDEFFKYLLTLLEEQEPLDCLMEYIVQHEGDRKLDSDTVMDYAGTLVSLDDDLDDEELRQFRRKVLSAILRMASPAKNTLFSSHNGISIVSRLVNGLSTDEIAKLMVQECITGDSLIPLRGMIDGLWTSEGSIDQGAFAERIAEIEAAIRKIMAEKDQEHAFDDKLISVFEEIFAEMGVNKLKGEEVELNSLLSQLYSSQQLLATKDEVEYIQELFTKNDKAIDFAFMLMDMLESETDLDEYSDISKHLGEIARFMIMTPIDTTAGDDRYFTVAFQIMDTFSRHVGDHSLDAPEFRVRAKRAIDNLASQDVISRALSVWSKSESLEWEGLEEFIKLVQEEAITAMVDNLLNEAHSPGRWKMIKALTSLGSAVVKEIRKRISRCKWDIISRDIIPILSQIGGDAVIDCLSETLNHKHPQVRKASVLALMTIGGAYASNLLLNKLKDGEEEKTIRQLALSALGEISNERTFEEISRIISEKDEDLNHDAIRVLGSMGGEKAITILGNLLKQKSILHRRRLKELQLNAVKALRHIGTPTAIRLLMEMSRRKRGSLRHALEEALEH